MKMILGLLLGLFTSQFVFAESMVSCKTTGKKPALVLDYLIRSKLSQRLASDITYYVNNVPTTLSFDTVAQYGTQKEAIYLLLDNAEIPTLRLFAGSTKKGYSGNIANYNAAGKIVKTTAVDCTISPF